MHACACTRHRANMCMQEQHANTRHGRGRPSRTTNRTKSKGSQCRKRRQVEASRRKQQGGKDGEAGGGCVSTGVRGVVVGCVPRLTSLHPSPKVVGPPVIIAPVPAQKMPAARDRMQVGSGGPWVLQYSGQCKCPAAHWKAPQCNALPTDFGRRVAHILPRAWRTLEFLNRLPTMPQTE